MNDRANVFFIDTHTVGAGRAEDGIGFIVKPFFDFIFFRFFQTRVIKTRRFFSVTEHKIARDVFGADSRRAKNYHRPLFGVREHERRMLFAAAVFDAVADIRTIAFRSHDARASVEKHFRYAGKHLGRSRRGKSGDEGRAEFFDDVSERQIRRAETVAPFGNAVRFVDGDVRDCAFGKAGDQCFVLQHFGICQNDLRTRFYFIEIFRPLFGALAAPKRNIADISFFHTPPLIGHEREEGIDDERRPVQKQGGNEKAQGFSGSRRKEDYLPAVFGRVFAARIVCTVLRFGRNAVRFRSAAVVRFRLPAAVRVDDVRDDEALPRIEIAYAESAFCRTERVVVQARFAVAADFFFDLHGFFLLFFIPGECRTRH